MDTQGLLNSPWNRVIIRWTTVVYFGLIAKECVMMRIAIMVWALALAYFCTGCRCCHDVSHSVETTYRTTANPWDDRVIDKIDLSVTVRRSW